MKSIFFAGLAGAALPFAAVAAITTTVLVATTVPAFAVSHPIAAVDVIAKRRPGGNAVQVNTDATGTARFGKLMPGGYNLQLHSATWGSSSTNSALHIVLIVVKQSSSGTPVFTDQRTVSPGQTIHYIFSIPSSNGPTPDTSCTVTILN